MSSKTAPKVIDSHLHVWADSEESTSGGFPYLQDPPDNLKDRASTSELLRQMDAHGVDGALIVQPINHKFDHSYVIQAIKSHPDRLKGMLLHDPSLEAEKALDRFEGLALNGFVGVRFNPYLWPKTEVVGGATTTQPSWSPMSQGAGLAVYKRCGELKMPVGVMCFQGLELHYDDILELLKASPETVLILDHFGFCSLEKDAVFQKLMNLASYPQVMVKMSALFRLGDASPSYESVRKERFLPLLQAFGPERLMFGSDFPFVLEQAEQYGTVDLVSSWIKDDENAKKWVMGGTAEKAFGSWGVSS